MKNTESSEAEEKIAKTRETPWIHPGAVADLIRSGEAEDRDRPALKGLCRMAGRLAESDRA